MWKVRLNENIGIIFKKNIQIPLQATGYLTDISYMQGLQELYKKQVPQKLKALREYALIESAVSSNRIEGVEVDKSRIGTLIFGKPVFIADSLKYNIKELKKC